MRKKFRSVRIFFFFFLRRDEGNARKEGRKWRKVVVIIRIVGGSTRFEQIFIARMMVNVTLFSPFSLLYILSR